MIKSMRRMFGIYRRARGRLILSQIMVLASATATIAFASLNQKLVNQGIEMNNYEMVVNTGLQMLVLALISGACLAVAAYIAVYFSQGIGYVIRTLLYEKIQTFSFANFDRFPTSAMMVRLNADVVNVQNAMLYSTVNDN
jgi:ABC-type multidrug transport system fused ATPase/permease subunit